MALGRQGLPRGERGIRVTVLGDALASDFCGTQPRREPCRAQLRLRLTRALDDGFHSAQQGGPVGFYGLTPTGGKGSQTREPTFQLMGALTAGHPAPAAFPFCASLAAGSQCFDCPGYKEPSGAAFEGASCVHEECLKGSGELHRSTSSKRFSGAYHVIWDNLI
jgi:hypothetical protein